MENEKKYLFDDPNNIKRLLHIFYACCVVLVILDFVIHRHIYHSWENVWAFYPIYGFVGCVVLVVIATWMRTFLMREESYYQRIEGTEQESANSDEEDTDTDEFNDNKKLGEHNVDA